MPMIAMTTKSSTSVKPCRGRKPANAEPSLDPRLFGKGESVGKFSYYKIFFDKSTFHILPEKIKSAEVQTLYAFGLLPLL